MSIYLDREWKKGNLLEVRENHVVYSLGSDTDEFIITKDEARDIIRDRKIVSRTGNGSYAGSNPLVFGPHGVSIYGGKIVERKDRPNCYRVEIKYKPLEYGKVQNIRISLGKHVSFLLAFVCLFCLVFACFCLLVLFDFYL